MLDRDQHDYCLQQAHQAHQAGRGEEALAWADEALRHDPRSAEAYNARGELMWDLGRCEEALREFRTALEIESDYSPAELNRIEILIEDFQEYEEALELGDELLKTPLEQVVEAEIYYLKAKALFYLEDLDGALFLLKRAIKAHGELGIYRGFEGQILFERARFDEALHSLKRAQALEPETPHTLYHLGLCHEHLGCYAEADDYFARASELDDEAYPAPVRMSELEFEQAASDAFASLPEAIRRYVRNCPIIIEDLPDRELLDQGDLSPQILGLFQGMPSTEAGADSAVRSDTDRILLFKRNLEKVALAGDDLIEQIQVTVKHEIGHYLGLDEDEIERLGLA